MEGFNYLKIIFTISSYGQVLCIAWNYFTNKTDFYQLMIVKV